MSTCCYKDFVNAAEICGGDIAGAWDGAEWSYVTSGGTSYPSFGECAQPHIRHAVFVN